jgi:hypothetical protein
MIVLYFTLNLPKLQLQKRFSLQDQQYQVVNLVISDCSACEGRIVNHEEGVQGSVQV